MGSNYSNYLAIQNKIFDTLINEAKAGGRLYGVKDVGDTWLLETNLHPYVYVDFDGFSEDTSATQQRKLVDRFIVGISYKSAISLSDARKNLKLLLDDGTGNGLAPILRDPANFSWGALASWSGISNFKIYDNGTGPTSTPNQYVAYAVGLFEVIEYMNLQGTPG